VIAFVSFRRRGLTSPFATWVVALSQPHVVALLLRAPASSAPVRAPDFIRSRHDVYLHPFQPVVRANVVDNIIRCSMMSNLMLLDGDDVRSVLLSSCLVLWGSWCRRHSLLLHQLGGYGILPLVCTFFRRHVDYGTSHLRSPIYGRYFIHGTQLSSVSTLRP